MNLTEKLAKIKNLAENWSLRRLTLFGKITVIKSLLASQLVYVLTALRTCQDTLKEINKILFNFLWDGKGDKIKRTTIINDVEEGGGNMIDIIAFNKALKASWVGKYLDENNKGRWKALFDNALKELGKEYAFKSNLHKNDILDLEIKDKFVKEVLANWADINYRNSLSTIKDLSEQNLWNNSLIRIDGTPIFYRKWHQKGVTKVSHLLDQNTYPNFLSHAELKMKYNLEVPYLKYAGLKACIKKLGKKITTGQGQFKKQNTEVIQNVFAGNFSTKTFYKAFKKQITTKPMKIQDKWVKECEINYPDEINWETVYTKYFAYTNSIRLRNFQFKLLHRVIPTNTFLQKIGVKDTNKCSFCGKERETLIHLFWFCEKTKSFWKSLEIWFHSKGILPQHKTINQLDAFGLDTDRESHILGFCKLTARYYIYLCKLKNNTPNIKAYKSQLREYKSIEKEVLLNKVFDSKWNVTLAVI